MFTGVQNDFSVVILLLRNPISSQRTDESDDKDSKTLAVVRCLNGYKSYVRFLREISIWIFGLAIWFFSHDRIPETRISPTRKEMLGLIVNLFRSSQRRFSIMLKKLCGRLLIIFMHSKKSVQKKSQTVDCIFNNWWNLLTLCERSTWFIEPVITIAVRHQAGNTLTYTFHTFDCLPGC